MSGVPAPRENPDLLGHERAERRLLESWGSGRMPHAWLLGGIGGIGKATLAYRFARFVLAQGAGRAPGQSLYLPPEHPVFRRVRGGGHADFLSLERQFDDKKGRMKQDIAVDAVREVNGFLHRTTAEGGWRVVVVDGVEHLNASGHNAILKILEEPPPRCLLLLVTETPGGLLPTIRSRCRRLGLEPLAEPVVAELLGRWRPELPEDDRAALTRLAEGSIGRALGLAEAGGLELYRQLMSLLATLPRLDLKTAHGFAELLGRKGGEAVFETVSELLVWWLARLVRALARGELPPETVAGEAALMARLAANGGLDRWMEVWDKVRQLFARADTAALDRKQVVLTALLAIEAATS